MKKKISVLLLTIVAVLSLTACGKFTCDECGEEKSGKSYEITFMDEEMTVCKDCKEELKELEKRKFSCDACGEEKSGRSYKVMFLGEEMTLCKDCKKEWDELRKELQDMYK